MQTREIVKGKFDVNNPMRVGGQAVIEGVMIRAPGMIATAVRRRDGSITIRTDPYVSLAERTRLFGLPLLRGGVGLVEMLIVGIRTLNTSAELALIDAEPDAQESGYTGKASLRNRATGESLRLSLTVGFAVLVGVAIFFAAPLVMTTAFFHVEQDPLRFNMIAGGSRLMLFLGYLTAISFMKDVRRLFEYHGAEHKAVFAYERGEGLDVASTARQSRFHPRCGTSFLLIVMLVAIVLFGLLDTFLIRLFGGLTLPLRLATHLPLIPLVGGVSYEFIRASARRSGTPLGRIIAAPGLWLQRITTKEPDERQLEVALAALRVATGGEVTQQKLAPPAQLLVAS